MKSFLCGNLRIAALGADIAEAEKELSGGGKYDIAVLAHAAEDVPVDLIDEIRGRSDVLARLAALSAEFDLTAIAGLYLRYGGIRKLSAAVAHRGELVDVTDSCSASEPYTRGGMIRLYKTRKGNVVVLVGGDARVRFIMEKLSGLASFAVCLEPEYRPENGMRVEKLSAEFRLPVLYASSAHTFLTAPFSSDG